MVSANSDLGYDHDSPRASACCSTSSTAASSRSGGYLYLRRMRLRQH